VECEKEGLYVPAKVVDHIIPINGGDDVLFWPEWNHQPLCQTHHNRKTMQQDPITKARRKAGLYREQEVLAARRNDWMYRADSEARD
jgi:5-methylcytosine-specific restriction endonuclease McrA